MQLDLHQKTALITGGSRGIGRAIAARMSASGANVMISSRKQDSLDETAREISAESGNEVATFAANAGDPEQATACVAATVERFGSVDILVNNAATNPYYGPAIEIDPARYEKTFQVNVHGPLLWAQEAFKASMAEGGGSIINISSIGGLSIEQGIGIYNTTKAALLHLTKVLASELAPGVRVNAICPGLVKTDMARALWEPHEEVVADTMPMKRLGEPADIAHMATFLASDEASWITGGTFVVDGGALIR